MTLAPGQIHDVVQAELDHLRAEIERVRLGWPIYAEVAQLRAQLAGAAAMRAELMKCWDEGHIEHDDGCPGDDTCSCAHIAVYNAALASDAGTKLLAELSELRARDGAQVDAERLRFRAALLEISEALPCETPCSPTYIACTDCGRKQDRWCAGCIARKGLNHSANPSPAPGEGGEPK